MEGPAGDQGRFGDPGPKGQPVSAQRHLCIYSCVLDTVYTVFLIGLKMDFSAIKYFLEKLGYSMCLFCIHPGLHIFLYIPKHLSKYSFRRFRERVCVPVTFPSRVK